MKVQYSKRQRYILERLLSTDVYITLDELANQLHVSSKTITREFQELDYLLATFHLKLENKRKQGYRLIGEESDIEQFRSHLQSSQIYNGAFDQLTRREKLLIECLQKRRIDKLTYFAQLFHVSEATVSKDIKAIEEWLYLNNLSFIRLQSGGLELRGDEKDIHQAKANFFNHHVKNQNLRLNDMVFDEVEYFQNLLLEDNTIMNLLNKEILFSVIKLLKNTDLISVHQVTQNSYLGLIIHLTIAIERIRQKESIEMDAGILEKMQNDPLFPQAEEFARHFESFFEIRFPREEIAYILMHLKGCRLQVSGENKIDDCDIEGDFNCSQIVEKIILQFSRGSNEDFTHDEDLFQGFMAHLKPALNRIYYGLSIRNPLLEQIKEQYSELFSLVTKACTCIRDNNGNLISEHEIGYLTLHFGAAMERKKAAMKKNVKLYVGIVCMSGIGVSVMLASTIRNMFPDLYKVIALSADQIQDEENLKYLDVIVTTLDISGIDIPVIQVSPILNQEDIEKLEQRFMEIKYIKMKTMRQVKLEEDYHTYLDFKLIEDLKAIDIHYPMRKDQLINYVIRQIDQPAFIRMECEKAVIEREKYGEVKLSDQHFVLFHASVGELKKPYLVIFRSHGSLITDNQEEVFEKGVLMLMPRPAKKMERLVMGRISHMIMNDDCFRDIVLYGDAATIYEYICVNGQHGV